MAEKEATNKTFLNITLSRITSNVNWLKQSNLKVENIRIKKQDPQEMNFKCKDK